MGLPPSGGFYDTDAGADVGAVEYEVQAIVDEGRTDNGGASVHPTGELSCANQDSFWFGQEDQPAWTVY